MTLSHALGSARFDKIADTQKIFRVMLEALARPGQLYRLSPVGSLFSSASGKFDSFETTGSLLATLLDHEVTFCVLGQDDRALELSLLIGATTGSRSVPRDKADYVVTLEAPAESLLSQLNPGSLLFPNTATTLICRVENLANQIPEGNSGAWLELSGPGVAPGQTLGVAGVKATFFNELKAINAGYPLGLDIIWVTPHGTLAGLPRSTQLAILEG
jgi:alpha-D-ribose 1-methylphosphonate 5-triphosphate synthase subunit PhnH